MAERAMINMGVQLSPEVTPGTAVAASKKLLGTSIELGIESEVKTYRPSGGKFSTITALGKEWASASISGPLTYTDIVYLAAGNIAYAAPVQQAATIAYLWTHTPAQSTADVIKTYTVEQGDAVRAHRAAYGLVDSLGYTITRDEAMIKGSMLLDRLEDGIAMTAAPTSIALVPVLPTQVCIYSDPLVANIGTTQLLRVLSIDWEYSARFSALWTINCNIDGFAAHVETEPKPILKIMMEADAAGMAWLDKMRVGTRSFIRVQATGGLIVGVYNYLFTHDISGEVIKAEKFSDQDGVYAIGWEIQAIYDAGWAKAFNLAVINALTAL